MFNKIFLVIFGWFFLTICVFATPISIEIFTTRAMPVAVTSQTNIQVFYLDDIQYEQ